MKELLLKYNKPLNFFNHKALEEIKEELLETEEFKDVEELIIQETRDDLPTTIFRPEKGDKFDKTVIINSISYNGIFILNCSVNSIIRG